MTLPLGLYDLLLTEGLRQALDGSGLPREVSELPPESAAASLIDAFQVQLTRMLDRESSSGEALLSQLELVNALLCRLRELRVARSDAIDPIATPPQVLRAVYAPASSPPEHPTVPLGAPWLFTAGRGSPALLEELRREAASCDQIDILVSFITIAGVRKLADVLERITAPDARGNGRTRIRVLTTTYTGATEMAALDALARLNGCELRISLDGRRSRLHAKAWIFHRRTGFGSAYVGSANLSGAALLGGLEWTVKVAERGQASLFERAKANFDTLWLDDEFTRYEPGDGETRAAVSAALRRESGELGGESPRVFFDIQPKPYQAEMLDDLEFERAHGRFRNLLVAATGTGKTVVAALDYRRLVTALGHRPRLLFVAHRRQILQQAMATYRQVLRDHSFGELLSGGLQPDSHNHLFATIDSLTSRQLVEQLGPEYWHTIVIDECHRLAADRFDRLVTTVQPRRLLGLTATPERTDGRSIERYFHARPDGSPAAELRLWDALDMQLLAPFEYYGCDDPTDFSDVPWNTAGEVSAIDRLVTGNDVRIRMMLHEWTRLSGDPRRSKALIFCASVAHAKFVTQRLSAQGLPVACVVGETSLRDRLRAPRDLADGTVCALVTVDLYNEGVDIPEVDTLILLRPTQSPVLFQQQIGRGLRLHPGKDSCLILDFVGQHRAEFRFDHLLSGITGLTRGELVRAVEHGFSTLPPGCHVHLQRQTRDQVLRNLKNITRQSWRRLSTELRSYVSLRGREDLTLAGFLHDQHIELEEVYRPSKPSGWTSLKRAAGLLPGQSSPDEQDLSRRFGWLTHSDDADQIATIRRVAESGGRYLPANRIEAIRAQMLTYQIDNTRATQGVDALLQQLEEHPNCRRELAELADVLEARSRVVARALPGAEDIPLQLHGAYEIREILTAWGVYDANRRFPFQAGVCPIHDRRTELLFVTLDKSEAYHERVAYHDYAISPSRFHWQTQNSVGPDTDVGRRYRDSTDGGWAFQLFVRTQKAAPYRACGPVRIASPEDLSGNRPMNITWTLEVPLPPKLFQDFSVLRSQ